MENAIQFIRVSGLKSAASAPSITRTLARVQVRSVPHPKRAESSLNNGQREASAGNIALSGMLDVLELKLNPQ